MQRWMKRIVVAAIVLAVVAGAAPAIRAADPNGPVTVAGEIVCAKCTLELPGLDHCQNVLLVGDGAQRQQYWIANNAVNEAFGDVCTAKRPVSVTGSVHTKDGKEWLTPTKIEPRDR